jgi:hypothetical protein
MPKADNSVSDAVIGPPQPSGADFFLPQRGAKSLDAAEVAISHSSQTTNGAGNPAGQSAPAQGTGPRR